ncbi:MAG: acetolactate synthase large subunit [Terriglobales bacterium]
MNGAQSLIATLVSGGVEVCFTNPGTSEMHLVAALDRQTKMRCVLGLFEGVVTAAADGYARMTGKPACTLVHLGPGLANGIANLHNAARAHVPIVNIVGQHALSHLIHDTPLKSDIEAIARPYSAWLRTSHSSSQVGRDTAEALVASQTAPGRIATLIVPANVAWEDGGSVGPISAVPAACLPSGEKIENAAQMLRSKRRTAILLAGSALHGAGLAAAGRIAGATGAKLLVPYPFARVQRGAGTPVLDRIPYVHEQAAAMLSEFQQIILIGTEIPFAYFASQNRPGALTSPDCSVLPLASPSDDIAGALDSLSAMVGGSSLNSCIEKPNRTAAPHGAITLDGLAQAVASLLPENAIVADESMTSGRGMMAASRGCVLHDWLANTGGSIGIALPLAVGAAVACPERRVLCLSADGSGMYTVQALWTMAREALNITTVIFANRLYSVLKREYLNLGIGDPGKQALNLFEIGRPDLDWVALAQGMGIPGTRVTSLDEFVVALRRGFGSDGPTLIEVPL